ncbi:MAG: cupin domain-containing protein [Bacillota bacterium]
MIPMVPAGQDRFSARRYVLNGLAIDTKVSPQETEGGLFVIEHTDPHKGGPPRHIHHSQEEWFYVLEGEYVLEVGEQRYQLRPGDSALAPRGVPHVWAHVGDGQGRLLIGFQPAGRMDEFLRNLSQIEGIPSPERLQPLFRAHGMEIVGPPLPVK